MGGPGWGGGGRRSASRGGQSFSSTWPPETSVLAGLKSECFGHPGTLPGTRSGAHARGLALWGPSCAHRPPRSALLGACPASARPRIPPGSRVSPAFCRSGLTLAGASPGPTEEKPGAQCPHPGPVGAAQASSAFSLTVRGLSARARGPHPAASVYMGDRRPLSLRWTDDRVPPGGFTSVFFHAPASLLHSSGTQEVAHTLYPTDSVRHRLTDDGPLGPVAAQEPHVRGGRDGGHSPVSSGAGRGLQRATRKGSCSSPGCSSLRLSGPRHLLSHRRLLLTHLARLLSSTSIHRKERGTVSSARQNSGLSGRWVSGRGFSPQHPPRVTRPGSARLPTPRPARGSGTDALKALTVDRLIDPPPGAVPQPLTCASVMPCGSAARCPGQGRRSRHQRRRDPSLDEGGWVRASLQGLAKEGSPGRGGAPSPRQTHPTRGARTPETPRRSEGAAPRAPRGDGTDPTEPGPEAAGMRFGTHAPPPSLAPYLGSGGGS